MGNLPVKNYTNNKLSSITRNNLNITIQYNGLGDRVSQTMNSVTTNYTLDLNAGLTQVLQDGTNSYLYGNGRISQFTATTTEYFLGDALGSVRQLVDESGTITLAKSYEPYGKMLSSTGGGASIYGFDGEQVDSATGLTYLRARYYSNSMGRFMTRDAWQGDYTKPMSYNPWLFVYSNPINHRDPSGQVPNTEGVNQGSFIYSCNCGWIDLHHALPDKPLEIYKLLEQPVPEFPEGYTDFDKSFIDPDVVIYNIRTDYYNTLLKQRMLAVVKRGLSGKKRDEVALGIYMKKEELTENLQWWAGIINAHTYYAEEDLTSDLIAFYLMINNKRNPKDDEESWNWLAEQCDFPKDHNEAIKRSQAIWNNGAYIPVEGWKEWSNPRLCNTAECKGERKWPAKFTTVNPEMPNHQNGYWWEYSFFDGIPLASKNPDVFFLRYP